VREGNWREFFFRAQIANININEDLAVENHHHHLNTPHIICPGY